MSIASVDASASGPTFADLGLAPELVAVLARKGISNPLPIQAATIPDALDGRDVTGKAPTGSGKTLAFALPLVSLLRKGTPKHPRALILAPTRELAAQIAGEVAPLAATRGLRVHPFYGGVGFGPQIKALRDRVDIAVACPGRLEDLMQSGAIRLSNVEIVVVDEADRMADMGFLPCVKRILESTGSPRQTVLFSATLDGDVDVLIRQYQNNPARHEVVSDVDDMSRVTHEFRSVEHADRAALCAEVVGSTSSTVVFVRTKHGAERLAKQLGRAGVEAAAIHGDRTQAQRERALKTFRSGKVQALVATDVAARGIHVDEVGCVIHYDLPADHKDYVHRSGRTARAGASGSVVAFVTPDQRKAAAALRRALGIEAVVDGVAGVEPPDSSRQGQASSGPRGGRGRSWGAGGSGGRPGGSARRPGSVGRSASGSASRTGSGSPGSGSSRSGQSGSVSAGGWNGSGSDAGLGSDRGSSSRFTSRPAAANGGRNRGAGAAGQMSGRRSGSARGSGGRGR